MKFPKIIEIKNGQGDNSLVRVTFQAEDGSTWFADMTQNQAKVKEFMYKANSILNDKTMEELKEVLDIAREEGYDMGCNTAYDD